MKCALALVFATVLFAGCAPQSAWHQVGLGRMHPAALGAEGEQLLVSGSTDGAPSLVRITAEQVDQQFRLNPNEPYAETAALVAISGFADAVYAIGKDIGGAHANPRWTVWDGSLSQQELTSRPQEFFIFGGHDAGPLLGTAVLDSQPVIVGSRTTTTGARAVFYTRSGHTWSAPATSAAELSSSDHRELGFTAFAAIDDRLVIVGDALDLSSGVHQDPMLWVGRPSGSWQQLQLTLPAGLAGTGLSRATAVSCEAVAARCWVAGWALGHPVVWQVELPEGAEPSVAVGTILPGALPAGADPIARVTITNTGPVVATNAAEPALQFRCSTGWQSQPAPGPVQALAATNSQLYAISNAGLWRLEPSRC